MWAVWRNKPSSGNVLIQAAQVYPRSESFSIELVDSQTSEARFDAAMGSDGLPRVAFISAGKKSLTICRRTDGGVWEKKITSEIPGATAKRYEEIALATRGTSLAVVVCEVEQLTDRIYGSELWSYWGGEPAQWSGFNFSSLTLLDDRNETGNRPSFLFPEVVWGPDANLHVATVTGEQFSVGLIQLNTISHAQSERRLVLGEFSLFVDPNLALAPDGTLRFGVCDQQSFSNFPYYLADSDSPVEIRRVTDLSSIGLDMELDAFGNPWLITRHPNENLLQVTAPTDVTDLDGDGVPALVEDALFMDSSVPDSELFPRMKFLTVDGRVYPSFTYRTQSGGSGSNPYVSADYSCTLEISDDLETWSSSPADVILNDRFTISGRGTINVYRSTTPVNQGEYFRLRVERR